MCDVVTEREIKPDTSGYRNERRQWRDGEVANTIRHRVWVSRQWTSDGTGGNDHSQCMMWYSAYRYSYILISHKDNCSHVGMSPSRHTTNFYSVCQPFLVTSGRITVGPEGALAHLKYLWPPRNICFDRVQGACKRPPEIARWSPINPSLQHVILSTHAGVVVFRQLISSDDQTRKSFPYDPVCRITVAYVNKI